MTGLEVKQLMEGLTDEELENNVIIQGWWDTSIVDERLEILANDYDVSPVLEKDKQQILKSALDICGEMDKCAILDEIDGQIISRSIPKYI